MAMIDMSDNAKFQFLLGTLKTEEVQEGFFRGDKVSIPFRYAENEGWSV